MGSRRQLKKEIDYLVSEVVSNCYTCLYFNPNKNRGDIFGIIEEAIEVRNELFSKMRPAEKNNTSLVKKHYAAVRNDMMVRIDELFGKLSAACK